MAASTKRQKSQAGKIDSNKLYAFDAALALVKECSTAKFDESIDDAVQLGMDDRKRKTATKPESGHARAAR
jgi:large subunit ribosomal protein L1